MSGISAHNEERLTGLHETQAIDQFSTAFPTEVPRFAFRLPSRPTDGLAASKTAVRRPTVTRTRSGSTSETTKSAM